MRVLLFRQLRILDADTVFQDVDHLMTLKIPVNGHNCMTESGNQAKGVYHL
jgi:hypothetical protein